MKQSKAGKKLNPLIAVHTAKIYSVNPERYKNLCRWVWVKQKAGWPDEAIANALEMAERNDSVHAAHSWWSYLTALLPKAKGRAVEAESDQYKKSDLTSLKSILREIIK